MFTFDMHVRAAAFYRVPMAVNFSMLLKRKPPRTCLRPTATFSWTSVPTYTRPNSRRSACPLRLIGARGKADSGPGISGVRFFAVPPISLASSASRWSDELRALAAARHRALRSRNSYCDLSKAERTLRVATMHRDREGFLLLDGDKRTPHRSTEGSISGLRHRMSTKPLTDVPPHTRTDFFCFPLVCHTFNNQFRDSGGQCLPAG